MKIRRGRNLRDFIRESEDGIFKGIEIVTGVG